MKLSTSYKFTNLLAWIFKLIEVSFYKMYHIVDSRFNFGDVTYAYKEFLCYLNLTEYEY